MIKLYNLISIGEASPTFGHENAFFYRPYKESISNEVNNDKIKICIWMTKCRAGFATADKIKLQVKGFLLKIDNYVI